MCIRDRDYVPEHPKEKTAFLTFPKGREYVAHRQIIADVCLYIGILIVLVDHHVKDDAYESEGGHAMKAIAKGS